MVMYSVNHNFDIAKDQLFIVRVERMKPAYFSIFFQKTDHVGTYAHCIDHSKLYEQPFIEYCTFWQDLSATVALM